jgi:hypothetical protein
MTAKEKALELGNMFYRGSVFDKSKEEHLKEIKEAKTYALKAVDEIISVQCDYYPNDLGYWEEVYTEIEKL